MPFIALISRPSVECETHISGDIYKGRAGLILCLFFFVVGVSLAILLVSVDLIRAKSIFSGFSLHFAFCLLFSFYAHELSSFYCLIHGNKVIYGLRTNKIEVEKKQQQQLLINVNVANNSEICSVTLQVRLERNALVRRWNQ